MHFVIIQGNPNQKYLFLQLLYVSTCSFLEPLQNKNRQMKMPTFRLMKDQAVTKTIQMFPPCRFIEFYGRRPAFYAVSHSPFELRRTLAGGRSTR